MSSTILEVIKKQNIPIKNPNEFINYLEQQESNQENREIIEKLKKERDVTERIQDFLRDIQNINSGNNINSSSVKKIAIKKFLSVIKKNIINYVKSLRNIYKYKTDLTKKIGLSNFLRAYLPDIKFESLTGFEDLEKLIWESKKEKKRKSQ